MSQVFNASTIDPAVTSPAGLGTITKDSLLALQGQFSGAAAPATPVPYQWWADTTTGLLKIRNAANTAWINVGDVAQANLGWALAGGSSSQAFNASGMNGGQLSGFRNKIINGDMQVSQVNGGTAVTPSVAPSYPIDQWCLFASTVSKLTVQQVADAPPGFKNSAKITVAAQYAPLATEAFIIHQPIEGRSLVDFQLGTAGAVTIATGQYIKGSVPGTYAVSVRNGAYNRSYVGTVVVTTSWTKLHIILVGDTSGIWSTDNTTGLTYAFDLGSGSNFNTPAANDWQAGSYLRTAGSVTFVNQVAGSTLNITGVQLEKVSPGATSGTEFEHVSYADQLRWCQRYCEVLTGQPSIYSGNVTSGGTYYLAVPFKVQKRASPTINLSGVSVSGMSATPAVYGGIDAFQVQITATATAVGYCQFYWLAESRL